MRILSSAACPAVLYFSTLSHKRHDFRGKKVIGHKTCVFSLTTFVWNISCAKKNWAGHDRKRISVFMWSTRYSCQILMKPDFFAVIFEKKIHMLNFMEIRGVGAELFHACRANVTVRSRNFPNAPKMIRKTNVACSERYSLRCVGISRLMCVARCCRWMSLAASQ